MALCPGYFPDCKLEIIWELQKISMPRPHSRVVRISEREAYVS